MIHALEWKIGPSEALKLTPVYADFLKRTGTDFDSEAFISAYLDELGMPHTKSELRRYEARGVYRAGLTATERSHIARLASGSLRGDPSRVLATNRLPTFGSSYRMNPVVSGARQAMGPGRFFGASQAAFEIPSLAGQLAVNVMGPSSEHPVGMAMISALNLVNEPFALMESATAAEQMNQSIISDSATTLYRVMDRAGSDRSRLYNAAKEYSQAMHVLMGLPEPSRAHVNGVVRSYLNSR